MKTIPITEDTLVLRVDYSDGSDWSALCAAIGAPSKEEGFTAYVSFVSDPAFAGLTAAGVLDALPVGFPHSVIFLADQASLHEPEHPILVIDLVGQPGRTFRVVPSEMWAVQNNLSLANMGFEEFADQVDTDGVFRGFPAPKRARP